MRRSLALVGLILGTLFMGACAPVGEGAQPVPNPDHGPPPPIAGRVVRITVDVNDREGVPKVARVNIDIAALDLSAQPAILYRNDSGVAMYRIDDAFSTPFSRKILALPGVAVMEVKVGYFGVRGEGVTCSMDVDDGAAGFVTSTQVIGRDVPSEENGFVLAQCEIVIPPL